MIGKGKNFSIKVIDKIKKPQSSAQTRRDPKEEWTLKVIDDHYQSSARASRSSSRAKQAIEETKSTVKNTKKFVKQLDKAVNKFDGEMQLKKDYLEHYEQTEIECE